MNIVLLVVDSLRACSLGLPRGIGPQTPFIERLGAETSYFRRAYATECWTLPAHCSMFTGLLPSEHGAHFQTMAYSRRASTLAEILAGAGYQTEIVTRNSLFDGSIPGVTRGFLKNTRLLAPSRGRIDPLPLLVAFAFPSDVLPVDSWPPLLAQLARTSWDAMPLQSHATAMYAAVLHGATPPPMARSRAPC